jgi:hypothetical protein
LMSQIVISSSQLTENVKDPNLKSQIATSSWGGRRKREILSLHHELSEKISDHEKKTSDKLREHAEQLVLVFDALRELIQQKNESIQPIGFKYGKQQE